MDKIWMVRGCGVSIQCTNVESIHEWVLYIIDKGGVPEVKEITGEL